MKRLLPILFALCAFTALTSAQKADSTKHHNWKWIRNGSFYGSWGYNTEWYTNSNIHISQPSDGNNYTFENISAHDHIGWDNVFHVQFTIPQYNYRLGYFFNAKQDWGVELNFDHTKYVVAQDYWAIVKGTYHGRAVDTAVIINNNTLRYQLNNGANWFLINLVKKFNIIATKDHKFTITSLLKAGVGPVVPHVDNTIFGQSNNPHFQLGGWDTGLEGTIRFTFFNCAYLEYCNKVDFADYWGLGIADGGSARQSFGAYEMILNFGITFHLHPIAGTNTAL